MWRLSSKHDPYSKQRCVVVVVVFGVYLQILMWLMCCPFVSFTSFSSPCANYRDIMILFRTRQDLYNLRSKEYLLDP